MELASLQTSHQEWNTQGLELSAQTIYGPDGEAWFQALLKKTFDSSSDFDHCARGVLIPVRSPRRNPGEPLLRKSPSQLLSGTQYIDHQRNMVNRFKS
jgi:hypothetical protein